MVRMSIGVCTRWGAHFRNLANTTEPSMCCCDTALSQITWTIWFLLAERLRYSTGYQWTRECWKYKLEMWASAQPDGRPAAYRWRRLFNAAVWLTPTTRRRAVTLPRRETSWNLQGCPILVNRSQPLVGWSSPYSDFWGHVKEVLLLNKFFFRLLIRALVAKI